MCGPHSNSPASHGILTQDSPVDLEKEKRRKGGEKGGKEKRRAERRGGGGDGGREGRKE